jgi:hypothetical protein
MGDEKRGKSGDGKWKEEKCEKIRGEIENKEN